MQLPTVISLSDTATLNELMRHGITIDDLLARGEYVWNYRASEPKGKPVAQAKTETTEKGQAAKQRNLL